MKIKITIAAVCIIIVLVISCRKKALKSETEVSGDPVLPEVPYEYSGFNSNLVTLGRVLFYDKKLSLNNSVSCGSCHQQSKAFCDNQQFSTGLEDLKTKRNAPSIFARNGNMFWDGRAASMNALVLMPVKNHVEMKFGDLNTLVEKIGQIGYYADLFKNAFGTVNVDTTKIKMALTSFVSNFQFSSNRFNRSEQKKETLTASEELGRSIFFGNGRCSRCHHIVDPNPGGSGGGYGSTPSFVNNNFNIGLDKVYADQGIGAISNNTADNGKFVVPVLLNVEYTGPYMHDGRYKTLEEVVEHYSNGIYDHPNLDAKLRDLGSLESLSEDKQLQALDANHNNIIDPAEVAQYPAVKLNLTSIEKKSLVDFLKTLSDPSIFAEKKFSDPFK